MSDSRPIGVFDSGLGGLTVVKELNRLLPKEDIVYFGDTGRVPYGNRSENTIKRYAREDENFLLSQDVKIIIAACGTVSSVASDVSSELTIPFFEVVSHASHEAVRVTRNKKIGVIGTAATIKSGKHKEYISVLLPKARVIGQSCPLFVPLVEEGWYNANDVVVKETVNRYLTPFINEEIDTLILGCTHYPVLSEAISSVLGEGVTLVNAGTATAKAVFEFLKTKDMLSNKEKGENQFYVSDKADSFRTQASILLGDELDDNKVRLVSLSSL
ncbi:MAG: glutamate racemase [Clostridia bacterium]|nr:glutamate racemase [Clostridia bacterium]